jgi:signal transduction histidine kinase
MARLSKTHVDVVAATLLTWLAAATTLDPPGPVFPGPVWVVWLAAGATALPLSARRHWPVPVFAATVTAAGVSTVAGVVGIGALSSAWAPVAMAMYTVAARAGRASAAGTLAAGLAVPAVTIPWLYQRSAVTAADSLSSEVPLWWQFELFVVVVLVAATWAGGRAMRWRRLVRAEAERRLARDAVAAERLRIARELHDIVGHSMSLIAVKATVANHIAAERPDETRAALVTIERTSRAALTEMRRMLDVLRAGDEPDAELAPVPGAADLAELAGRVRSAGLRVELRQERAEELPDAVGLTVYRIVQEALTNVLRHAQAARCDVSVVAGGGRVLIEILDDGRTVPASQRREEQPRQRRDEPAAGRPGGRGLIGMRERAAAYGGTLSTGPRPEGGFRVAAEIPYSAREDVV